MIILPHSFRCGMASPFTLQPLKPFNLRSPDEWPKWKYCFLSCFGFSCGVQGATGQHSSLLPGRGSEQCFSVYNIKEEENEKFSVLLENSIASSKLD